MEKMEAPALTTISAQDELAIRNLVARYADSTSRGDAEAWAGCWAEDATWQLGDVAAGGRSEIVSTWLTAMAKYSWLIQLVASGQVWLDGEVPKGIWYIAELQQHRDGKVALMVGRYEDSYVQEDGDWSFADRQFQLVYRGEPVPAEVAAVAASSLPERSGAISD